MTFHERKATRRKYFESFVKGWRQRPCTACNGSGVYDNTGSPTCGACEGTKVEKYKYESK